MNKQKNQKLKHIPCLKTIKIQNNILLNKGDKVKTGDKVKIILDKHQLSFILVYFFKCSLWTLP